MQVTFLTTPNFKSGICTSTSLGPPGPTEKGAMLARHCFLKMVWHHHFVLVMACQGQLVLIQAEVVEFVQEAKEGSPSIGLCA
jgi:hypothetical protein